MLKDMEEKISNTITIVEFSSLMYFDATDMDEKTIEKEKRKLISKKIARLKKSTGQYFNIDFEYYKGKFFFVKFQNYIVLCGIDRIAFKKEYISNQTQRVHMLCDYILYSKRTGFFTIHCCEETNLKYEVGFSISPTVFFINDGEISSIKYLQTYASNNFNSVIIVKNERSYTSLYKHSIKLQIFRDGMLTYQKDAITVLDELPMSNGYVLFSTEEQDENGMLPTSYSVTLLNCISNKEDKLLRRGWGVGYRFNYPSALYLTELDGGGYSIEDETNIFFYIAKVNTVAYQAVKKIANTYGKIEEIKSPLEEDITINEKITIPKTAPKWVGEFIFGVITKSNSLYPQFFGVAIHDIIETMFDRLDDNPYALPQHYCDKLSAQNVLNYIREHFNMNDDEIVRYLATHYGSYSLISRYNKYWMYYHEIGLWCEYLPREAEELLNVKLNKKYVESLDIRTYDVKWKSEYELYVLTKKYFPEAIMHYSAPWLGLQHLDIFIPSLNLAFEYQGEQHYKGSDYFGGEDAYEERVRLDKEKKELCKLNSVDLIDWHFSVPITAINFIVALKKKTEKA